MKRQIIPEVHEISLAFNPANLKKFHLRKELKGEELMKKAIAVLQSQDKMFKETEFLGFLDTLSKDKLTNDDREYISGAYKLLALTKDNLPASFIEDLVKAVPEFQPVFTIVEEAKVDREEIKKELKTEMEPQLRIEIKKEVETEMKKDKDEVVEDLKTQIETLRKDVKTSQEDLQKEADARRTVELITELKDESVPDPEKRAATILKTEKLDKDAGNELKESLIASAKMVKEAMGEIGTSRDGIVAGDAYEKLQKEAKIAMEKDVKLQLHEAMAKVARENPKLYAEYNKERLARINSREGGK